MNKIFGLIIAGLGICLSCSANALPVQVTTQPEGLSSMTVAQARAFAVAAGGTVRSVEDLENGAYEMIIDYPDGIPVYINGETCSGAGDAKKCAQFESAAYIGFDSEGEALAAEHAMDIVWLSDKQIGLQLKVWRYEFVAGMTARHLEDTFAVFLDTVQAAWDVVKPVSPDPDGTQGAG